LIECIVATTAVFIPLASVTGQAPTASFPASLITSSPPPAIAGVTNAASIPLASQMNVPQASAPTITVPQAAAIQIPQALIPASTAPQLPASTYYLPHTTPTMPRLPPPQAMAPTVQNMAIAPIGRIVVQPPPSTAGNSASFTLQTSGVMTNADGSIVMPMTSVPTNIVQPKATGDWDNKQPEIDGIKYHW
jgi:hypothetical protein